MADTIVAERVEDVRLETARKMICDGIPLEAISRYAGLSPEQVERLKESL
jgi:hypothetical protein